MKGRGEEERKREGGKERKECRKEAVSSTHSPNKLTEGTITDTFIVFVPKTQLVQKINRANKSRSIRAESSNDKLSVLNQNVDDLNCNKMKLKSPHWNTQESE